ncbi:MlaC/ttg2D family ABC transporter substrate-binding protein [Rickettsiales endosymbiont of Stachyamoeba lipophora]|uniref:MlaC/ttg2D family ABC transporter substrate-binding protein n=1 Tax=Rickettsiales endosymbiont of Stachyamoeba lipophora TaxID=2486578 RepID=UPI000F64AF68|nr:ABC transporter substrate-binding protein [Rickettsiales endosymbiont of Stachyamoeba lipophora]AZL14990.1 ABC transporter substrate-binding protein [Rickettsiales endosymbiont of Stachyamoeba lipophora]
MSKIILAALMLLSFNAFATPSKQEAKDFINNISHDAISIIQNTQLNDSQKQEKLSHMFINIIDIGWISKFVLGANFKQVSPDEFQQFTKAYQHFLINRYVPKFKQYNRDEIKILDIEQIDQNRFKVSTIIDRKQESDVKVDYMIKYYDNTIKFKIFDIIAEDISMIATHRTEFNSLFNQQGFSGLFSAINK